MALKDAFEKLPPCIVGMEACLSAHFVSRTLRALGHEPRIIPAIYVKPFVKGQKNDYNDAEAIAEAALRPNLRVVQEKTPGSARPAGLSSRPVPAGLPPDGDDQPDPRLPDRAGHRRQGWPERSAQLAVRDIGEPQGRDIAANGQADRRSLRRLAAGWTSASRPSPARSKSSATVEANCRRLMSVPGIGPLISTGMVAAIGTGEAFERGRDFGAWLGLVPRQYSTGGRSILGRISKRGSKYLRTLLIQAAKVLLMRPQNWPRFSFGAWLKTASERLHRNKLAVALANKLARIAWSVLRNDKSLRYPS